MCDNRTILHGKQDLDKDLSKEKDRIRQVGAGRKPIIETTEGIDFEDKVFFKKLYPRSLQQAELGIRAWALIHNFAPSTAITIRKHNGWQSPAERLNQQLSRIKFFEKKTLSSKS